MASAGLIVERFAAASGLLPSTLDRMLRPLRAAGLVPTGEPGRGQRRGHYEPEHLASVLLAFAGDQPSDAAVAAAAMGSLRYRSTEPTDAPAPADPNATLAEAVSEMVREAAQLFKAQARGEARGFVPKVPAWVTLSMSGSRLARVEWRPPAHGPSHDHLYFPEGVHSARHAVVRVTSISQHLIYAAGELWADTRARRDDDAAVLGLLRKRWSEIDERER